MAIQPSFLMFKRDIWQSLHDSLRVFNITWGGKVSFASCHVNVNRKVEKPTSYWPLFRGFVSEVSSHGKFDKRFSLQLSKAPHF